MVWLRQLLSVTFAVITLLYTGGTMANPQRERVFVHSADGKPTLVSSQPGNFAARLFARHRISTLREAKQVGLLPAFVNLEALQKEVDRVRNTSSFDLEAEKRVGSEIEVAIQAGRTGLITTDRYRLARVAAESTNLRVADLAQVIEPGLDLRARQVIAGRSLKLLIQAPVDVVKLDLRYDLDVYTDLAFDRDVALAGFGDVRIYRGARIISNASHFIMRASSIQGNLLAVEAMPIGISLIDLAALV
jgi:hypothetical protein